MRSRFSFTWGTEVEKLGYVEVFNFMLHHYTEIGVTRAEMLLLVHLSSYRYNIANGESRPSRATIAKQMGYSKADRIDPLIRSLEEKGFLVVTRRPGHPSIYDASPFARATRKRHESSAAELGSPETGATSSPETGATVAPKRGPEEEEVEHESKHTLSESQPTPTPTTHLEEPELVPFGDDDFPVMEEESQVEGHRVPDLPIHRDVLAACGGRPLFPKRPFRLKTRLTPISQAIKVGDVLGDGVYAACLEALNGEDELKLPGVPVPATWVPWRLESARRYHWGIERTIDALYGVEALRKHCEHHLRKLGHKAPPAPKQYEKTAFPDRGMDLTMKE